MSSIATIPMAGDVRALVGAVAEHVENRSLLLDKFAFHKSWPLVEDSNGKVKWDEASRWSFMRIADGAAQLLAKDAQEKRRRARGQNVELHNQQRYNSEAAIAETLANVKWDSKGLQELHKFRASYTRRFLTLFRQAYKNRAAVTIGRLESRLAINLADSLIQNAGICLDRLTGLPFIPGSAIKGVCRHEAWEELNNASETKKPELLRLFCAVFGTAEDDFRKGSLKQFRDYGPDLAKDQKGAISFLPAYPVNADAKIVVDLTNVHYPDYYRTGKPEELRNEKPRPNPFPVVEAGAHFAFCLLLNRPDRSPALLEAATRWLHQAIQRRGLGAKTAAGYGWFSIRPEVLAELEAQEQREAAARAAEEEKRRLEAERQLQEAQRKASLTPEQLAKEELLQLNDEGFANVAKEIATAEPPKQQAFLQLLLNEKRERWKVWKRRKPDLAARIRETAEKLGFQLP